MLTKACNRIVLLKLSALSSMMGTMTSVMRLFVVHCQVMLLFVLVKRLLYCKISLPSRITSMRLASATTAICTERSG